MLAGPAPTVGDGFLRNAAWFGPARARGYLWLFALLNLATLVFIAATSQGGVDRNGFLLGTDFLSFWTAGQMLVGHENVYDMAAHVAAQRTYFGREDAYTAFFYPPSFLPFCYPLGFLPYFPALGLWLLTTAAAWMAAVRLWVRETGLAQQTLLLAAAFPPVVLTITHGQTSFLVAALLGLGTLLVCDRPGLAGICFGLATIKPQFGVLIPLVLALTGQWRVILVAGATAIGLSLLATLAFSAAIWADWLAVSETAQSAMNAGAVGFAKMQSPFAASRLLGAPVSLAYVIQATVSVGVAGALAWAAWRRRFSLALGSAMLAGAPLVTPFVLDYDLVLLASPLLWLLSTGFRPWEKLIAAATFAAPTVARPLAVEAGLPVMPFILLAFFVILVRRAAEEERA